MRKGLLDAQSKFRIRVGVIILAALLGTAMLSKVWGPAPLQNEVLVEATASTVTAQ